MEGMYSDNDGCLQVDDIIAMGEACPYWQDIIFKSSRENM